MPLNIPSYIPEMAPSNSPSASAYKGAVTGAQFGLKLVAILKIKLPANPAISQGNAAAELPLCVMANVMVPVPKHNPNKIRALVAVP